MIIINADDWGRSSSETDAALQCYRNKRITSVSAMVFMEDSERAAEISKSEAMDVGLHLNLSQPFSNAGSLSGLLIDYHNCVVRFLTSHKYAFLIYNPLLVKAFKYNFLIQYDEFVRLYAKPPTHVDGHHHLHLCTNMVLGRIIPIGAKVRRSFHFWQNEKSFSNREYRKMIDLLLKRRYTITDYFFALSQSMENNRMLKIIKLAQTENVEIMTHPANSKEFEYLMSDVFLSYMVDTKKGSFECL